jgi:tripartite-type tricarboxylate transporter receptor subunit TctC
MIRKHKIVISALILSALLLVSCSANQEKEAGTTSSSNSTSKEASETKTVDYPKKDINFIVPFNPGGGIDIAGRMFATELSNHVDVNVVSKNVTGASGTVGLETLYHANDDGYTFLFAGSGYPVPYLLGKYDKTYEDFKPVAQYAKSQLGFYVSGNAPYNTMEEFIEYSKSNEVKLGVSNGTLLHMATLAIEEHTGVTFKHINIGGTTAKPPELISGRIDGYIASLAEGIPYVQSSDFKCLGVFGSERSDLLEDTPTFEEMGYPYIFNQTYGIWAPKDTPQSVIDEFNKYAETTCNIQSFIDNLATQNLTVEFLNDKEYSASLKTAFDECKTAYDGVK